MDIKEIARKVAMDTGLYLDGANQSEPFYVVKPEEILEFSEALIESYKAELLNEVVEPVAYMTTDEEGSASMLFFDRAEALKYSGDEEPVNLFTESQLLSAVAKNDEEIELLTKERDRAVSRMKAGWIEVCDSGILAFKEMNDELRQQLKAAQEEIERLKVDVEFWESYSKAKLGDQLSKAEQRVSEACAAMCHTDWNGDADTYEYAEATNECEKAIRNGQWRKFVKEV